MDVRSTTDAVANNASGEGSTSVLGKRRKQRQRTGGKPTHPNGGGGSSGSRLSKEQRLARRQARLELQARGPSEADLRQFEELLSCVRGNVSVEPDVLAEIQALALPHPSLQMRFIEQLLATDKFALAKHELVKTFSMMKSVQHDPHVEISGLCLRLCNRGADVGALAAWELLHQYVDIPNSARLDDASGGSSSNSVHTTGLPLALLSSKVLKEAKAQNKSQVSQACDDPAGAVADDSTDLHLLAALSSICTSAFQNHQGKDWVLARALCTASAIHIKQICNKDERTQSQMVDVMIANPVIYRRLIAEADPVTLIANFSRGLGFVLSRASDAFGKTRLLHDVDTKLDTQAPELEMTLQRAIIRADPTAERVHKAGATGRIDGNGDSSSPGGGASEAISRVSGDVKRLIESVLPGECAELRLFGSLEIPDLATPASDVDLCWFTRSPTLVAPSRPGSKAKRDDSVFVKLKAALVADNAVHFANVDFVSQARVPVLTFTHVETNLKVDLSVNNEAAVRNSELLKWQCSQIQQMARLLHTVRFWARRRRLIDPKYGLNAHGWTVLVAFFLQQRSHGCRLSNDPSQQPVYDVDQRVFKPPTAGAASASSDACASHESVVELLVEFWRFYAFDVDFARDRVQLGVGPTAWRGVRQVNKSKKQRRVRTSLVVIDPSEFCHGAASGVDIGSGDGSSQEHEGIHAEAPSGAAANENNNDNNSRDVAPFGRDLGLQLSKSDSLLLYAEFVRACRVLARLPFEDAVTVILQRRGQPRSTQRPAGIRGVVAPEASLSELSTGDVSGKATGAKQTADGDTLMED